MLKKILTAILSLLLLVSLGNMIWRQVQLKQAEEAQKLSVELSSPPPVEVEEIIEEEEEVVEEIEELPEEEEIVEEPANPNMDTEDAYADELKQAKDLALLKETNEDVIGWIQLPNTTLDYPLLQGEDNQHYLSYGWDGAWSYSGSVYLDYRSNAELTDFHSIIYGHRMYNNTMMDALGGYYEQSFWEEHPSVYILEENAVRRYDVFAAYRTDVRETHSYRLGLEDDAGQQAYINYCLKNSQLETGIVPELGDRILTLSTCTPQNEINYRWVVHCVLRYEELFG